MRYASYLFVFCVFGLFACNRSNQSSNFTQSKMEILHKEIIEIFENTSGEYALAFQEIGGEAPSQLLINHDTVFHAASTMKTPVMIEVFKQAAEGKFNLTDSILVKNTFYSIVDSSEYSLSTTDDSEDNLYSIIGNKRTIDALVYDMIIWSSNLATNLMIELVDAQKVTATMRKIGANNINVLRGVEDIKAYERGLNNTTTAYDLMVVYEKIAKGEAVSKRASERMIEILLDQKFNTIIPAKLPDNVKVAHKTGWISTVHHDSGIVILPNGKRYVIVLLSKNWDNDTEAVEAMATVSKLIYEFIIQKNENH